MLADSPIELKGLKDFNVQEVEETGTTFEANSRLKASSYALQTGCWTLADDSGLEVKALGNSPGVRSARFAGEGSSDEENVRKLLDELSQTIENARVARFVCAMSVSDGKGNIQFTSEGTCEGRIAEVAKGVNGFGYDPVFIPKGFDQTFGELTDEIKERLSHRSKALKKIISFFSQIPHSKLDQ